MYLYVQNLTFSRHYGITSFRLSLTVYTGHVITGNIPHFIGHNQVWLIVCVCSLWFGIIEICFSHNFVIFFYKLLQMIVIIVHKWLYELIVMCVDYNKPSSWFVIIYVVYQKSWMFFFFNYGCWMFVPNEMWNKHYKVIV